MVTERTLYRKLQKMFKRRKYRNCGRCGQRADFRVCVGNEYRGEFKYGVELQNECIHKTCDECKTLEFIWWRNWNTHKLCAARRTGRKAARLCRFDSCPNHSDETAAR